MNPPRMTTQTLKVLGAMLDEVGKEWYGLDLCKHSGCKPGTIYPILDRLMRVQWLQRRWEDIDPTVEKRPRRRLYRLSGVGASSADQALREHLRARPATVDGRRRAPSPRLA